MDGGMRQPGPDPSLVAVEALGAAPVQVSRTDEGANRRQSGGRARARDRLMDRATRTYPVSETLSHARGVENLVLFIDCLLYTSDAADE